MRNFISDLNAIISVLNSKKMTDIPVEGDPLDPLYVPLTPEEETEAEIKTYVNTKIDGVISSYDGAIAYLGTDSPFYHKTEPRKKTYNEMYIDMEPLVDDLSIFGENYKELSRPLYSTDIENNAAFYVYEFVEADLLDVSVYNTSDTAYWASVDIPTEKANIDALIAPVQAEISDFSSVSSSNGTAITNIVAENNAYFARMKSFLALDKTAKYIISSDPLGTPLYDSRTPASKATIDEILNNFNTMTDEQFSAYMKQKREDLKIER